MGTGDGDSQELRGREVEAGGDRGLGDRKSWAAAGMAGERQGQWEEACPPKRYLLSPHNGPSSLRSSAGRPPAETLTQASPLRLSFPPCITGNKLRRQGSEDAMLSIHTAPSVSSTCFHPQGRLPSR